MKTKFMHIMTVLTLIMYMFTGCGATTNESTITEKVDPESLTLVERIYAAETFDEIAACCNRTRNSNGYYSNYFEDKGESAREAKEAASKKIISYMFCDQKLNNFYHYLEKFLPNTWNAEHYGETSTDSIYIHVNSPDEIYIIPADLVADKNNVDLESIPNVSDYIYKAVQGELPACNIGEGYLQVFLNRVSDGYELTIAYYENDGYITVYEQFPYQFNENGEGTYSQGRDYYIDKEKSREVSSEDYEQSVKDKETRDKIKNSPPKVGMTASQVRQSLWREPDKINTDTYSWGTTEQWVYDDYGYVYFKNGIVTSVSER